MADPLSPNPGGPATIGHRHGNLAKSARLGYIARGAFYLTLAYLVIRVAMLSGRSASQAHHQAASGTSGGGGAGGQANAQGALSLVATSAIGKAALLVAAAGFLLLGITRLIAAFQEDAESRLRRLSVAGQGALYLALTWVPVSYLLGNHATGSEAQQRDHTAQVLGLPGGQLIVIAVGLALIGVCAWQIRGVLTQDFTDGMAVAGATARVRHAIRLSGSIGIAGRALLFVPLGVFLIIAGVTYDPRQARGLDAELLFLTDSVWGDLLLILVALTLTIFALYSFLEARYRDVSRGV
jgi:Domain of Unknown Function (DUF1206)